MKKADLVVLVTCFVLLIVSLVVGADVSVHWPDGVKTCGPANPQNNAECLRSSGQCANEPHKNCQTARGGGCHCGHRKVQVPDTPIGVNLNDNREPTLAVR